MLFEIVAEPTRMAIIFFGQRLTLDIVFAKDNLFCRNKNHSVTLVRNGEMLFDKRNGMTS